MKYIIGLGNPGEEYSNTRHNFGYMVLDEMAKAYNAEFETENRGGVTMQLAKIKIGKTPVTLVKPETFMNNSGKAIAALKLSKTNAEDIVVVHDELAIAEGQMRMSFDRSSAGHNGVESIIKALKTQAFTRLRIGASPGTSKGIAKVITGEKVILDRILKQIPPAGLKKLKPLFKTAIEVLEIYFVDGIAKAMTIANQTR